MLKNEPQVAYQNQGNGYLSNRLLKKSNVQIEWTKDLLAEYIKCSQDPIYFIENYMKIIHVDHGLVPFILRDYQREIVESLHNNRLTIICTARQAGKSTVMIGYCLWYILFNKNKTVGLLANKGDTARELLGRLQLSYQYLPHWLQQGVEEWNKGSLLLENGSRILAAATSSDAIRGYTLNCVTGDSIITIRDKETKFINILSIDELEKEIQMRNDSYGFVYLTTNLQNGKQYIGAHRIGKKENYLGSGKLFLKALKKYKPESFQQEILTYVNNEEELFEKEKQYILENDAVNSDKFYNISPGGKNPILFGKDNGFYGKTHSTETKQILSDLHKNKIISEKQKELNSSKHKELWQNASYRDKMKHRNSRRKFTEEDKIKHSILLKGRKLSEEHKNKISESRKEYFSSEDNLTKHKIIMNNKNKESYRTEEFKEQARQRRISYNKSEEKKEINRKNQLGKPLSEERKRNISIALKKKYANDKNH